jgi:hypothetical protein
VIGFNLLPLAPHASFSVFLTTPDNGRGDLIEEVPKGGYKVFYG